MSTKAGNGPTGLGYHPDATCVGSDRSGYRHRRAGCAGDRWSGDPGQFRLMSDTVQATGPGFLEKSMILDRPKIGWDREDRD